MINKKKDKTVQIIILLVIAVILAIILCILHMIDTLKENNVISKITPSIQKDIQNNPEDYTIKEILESYECKIISYSVESDEDDGRYYKIYLKFKHKLYENNVSQEEYFNSIVDSLREKVTIPFNLIDESKNIDIYVDFANNIFTINGIEDYFNNNSYIKVNSHKTTPAIKATRSSTELNMVLINAWSRHNLKIKEEPKDIDSEWIYYEGYKLNYTDININYIMFFKEYDSPIIDGIKVGDDFSKVKQTLGEPTYRNSNKMIGYKTVEGYVFFYDDCVVLYPCSDYINVSLEELIVKYYNNEYDGYRTNFVMEILEEYKDFKSEIIDEGIKLYSPSRGIELYLYDDGTTDIVIYDNYNLKSSLKKLAETNNIELKYDMDSIYLYEIERYSN